MANEDHLDYILMCIAPDVKQVKTLVGLTRQLTSVRDRGWILAASLQLGFTEYLF